MVEAILNILFPRKKSRFGTKACLDNYKTEVTSPRSTSTFQAPAQSAERVNKRSMLRLERLVETFGIVAASSMTNFPKPYSYQEDCLQGLKLPQGALRYPTSEQILCLMKPDTVRQMACITKLAVPLIPTFHKPKDSKEKKPKSATDKFTKLADKFIKRQ